MNEPTRERTLWAIAAGAVVGSVTMQMAGAIHNGAVIPQREFDLGAVLSSYAIIVMVLMVAIPILFMPWWIVARAAGLRGWLGSALAGAAGVMTGMGLFARTMSGYWGWPDVLDPESISLLGLMGVAGALTGVTIWRVTYPNEPKA